MTHWMCISTITSAMRLLVFVCNYTLFIMLLFRLCKINILLLLLLIYFYRKVSVLNLWKSDYNWIFKCRCLPLLRLISLARCLTPLTLSLKITPSPWCLVFCDEWLSVKLKIKKSTFYTRKLDWAVVNWVTHMSSKISDWLIGKWQAPDTYIKYVAYYCQAQTCHWMECDKILTNVSTM